MDIQEVRIHKPLFDDALNFRHTTSNIFRNANIAFHEIHCSAFLADGQGDAKQGMAGREDMLVLSTSLDSVSRWFILRWVWFLRFVRSGSLVGPFLGVAVLIPFAGIRKDHVGWWAKKKLKKIKFCVI